MTVFSLGALLCCAHGIAGCAAPEAASRQLGMGPGAAPEDLQIDVTVLNAEPNAGNLPAHERPARYVLCPGGELYYASEAALTASDAPPYVRTLDVQTVQAVWEQVAEPVFAEQAGRTAIGNIELVEPQQGQVTHVVAMVANGEHARFGVTRGVEEQGDPMLERLTRALAMLAWASDRPDADVLRMPRRYDFGPDPYVRYRENTGEVEEQGGDE